MEVLINSIVVSWHANVILSAEIRVVIRINALMQTNHFRGVAE